jgi:hypothetical protein
VASSFDTGFERAASEVRGALRWRSVLGGVAIGLVVGALGSAGLWYARQGSLRPLAAGAGALLGAAAGAGLARRRRFTDEEVALYLDAKLGADERITTAVLTREGSDAGGDVRAVVLEQAARVLESAEPARLRPRIRSRLHWLAPLGLAGAVAVSLAPLPPAPPTPPPAPGSELMQDENVAGLEKIEALAEVQARDDAQKKRLKDLADRARELREKLRRGAPEREVRADLAKLGDSIAAERLSLGDGEQRRGLEAALGQLGKHPGLERAQKALGDRDLTAFDEEMQRLANQAEKEAREQAKKALEEAAEAAEREGAKDVAKMLREQKKLLEQLEKRSQNLRELAKSLGDGLGQEGAKALAGMDATGDPESQRKLAEKLEEALKGLSAEQRKQLAENMKKQIQEQLEQMEADPDAMPPDLEGLKDLAEKLGTPEGLEELRRQLEEMAKKPPPESSEAERQRRLEDAQRGLGEAQQGLGAVPMPMPGQGPGQPGSQPGPSGNGNQGSGKAPPGGQGQGGPGGDSSPGPNGKGPGQATSKLQGGELRAHAGAKLLPGASMPGTSLGRTNARPGETANAQGLGALGAAGPGEVSGVNRSDVPEEYREQVGRYFEP